MINREPVIWSIDWKREGEMPALTDGKKEMNRMKERAHSTVTPLSHFYLLSFSPSALSVFFLPSGETTLTEKKEESTQRIKRRIVVWLSHFKYPLLGQSSEILRESERIRPFRRNKEHLLEPKEQGPRRTRSLDLCFSWFYTISTPWVTFSFQHLSFFFIFFPTRNYSSDPSLLCFTKYLCYRQRV